MNLQEFSCQEVRESSDDMVIFFATNSDMRRFLSILETMWHSKNVSFESTPRFAFQFNDIQILFFCSISTRIHHSRYPFCRKMISLRPMAVSCSTVWINHGNHFYRPHWAILSEPIGPSKRNRANWNLDVKWQIIPIKKQCKTRRVWRAVAGWHLNSMNDELKIMNLNILIIMMCNRNS